MQEITAYEQQGVERHRKRFSEPVGEWSMTRAGVWKSIPGEEQEEAGKTLVLHDAGGKACTTSELTKQDLATPSPR